MNLISFSLVPTLYAAQFENTIILLDSENDNYISLIDAAAEYLKVICQENFYLVEGVYYPTSSTEHKELNEWIQEFLEKGFICLSRSVGRQGVSHNALMPGGLREYQWDTKVGWEPFRHASKGTIFKALVQLAKIHFQLKHSGIKKLLHEIKKYPIISTYSPTKEEVEALSAAVDAASLLYPKKTYCLAWAATFALLALKKGWRCNFVIGIQTNPFYAHAWVEINGTVVNDDPIIASVLSIILREPGR